MHAVAAVASFLAISWPVSVLVDRTMHASGKRERRASTIGAAAVTSPTETAWTQILGVPCWISDAASVETFPNLAARLRRYFPVRSILAP
jgi:hypothetical protein